MGTCDIEDSVDLVESRGALVMIDPLKAFPNEGANIRVPLLPLYVFLLSPDHSPVGNDVVGRNAVKHIADGIHTTLITGTKPLRVSVPLNSLKDILDPADNKIFNSIM
jgi:hypothetical protein